MVLVADNNYKVPTSIEPWNTPGPHRASVNSFGYGGANAHAILENAEGYLRSRGHRESHRKLRSLLSPELSSSLNGLTNGLANGLANGHANDTSGEDEKHTRLFVLSALDNAAGKRQIANLSTYLQERVEKSDAEFMDNLAFTLNERRTKYTWKAAVSASSAAELLERLGSGSVLSKGLKKQPVIGFVFTGQGAQWCGMGKELLAAYPVFRSTIERIGAYLTSIGAPFDVMGRKII